jgi:hypothetical protein
MSVERASLRNALGDVPVQRLKARARLVVSAKPSFTAISPAL